MLNLNLNNDLTLSNSIPRTALPCHHATSSATFPSTLGTLQPVYCLHAFCYPCLSRKQKDNVSHRRAQRRKLILGCTASQVAGQGRFVKVAWQMPVLSGTKKTKRQDWHRDPQVWRPHLCPSAISSAVSWSYSNESPCHAVLLHTFSPAVRRAHSWIGSPGSQHRGTVRGAAIAH